MGFEASTSCGWMNAESEQHCIGRGCSCAPSSEAGRVLKLKFKGCFIQFKLKVDTSICNVGIGLNAEGDADRVKA